MKSKSKQIQSFSLPNKLIILFLFNCTIILNKISFDKFTNNTHDRNLSLQSLYENQESEACQYCQVCSKGFCAKCQDEFDFDEDKQICISHCEVGTYLDIYNTGKCLPHCGHFYEYEDDLHRVCKQVRECSLIMEIGLEYPDLQQDFHSIDEDLNIMISADYYNINLFDITGGVQISKIPVTQGIRQLVYVLDEKTLYVLKANGDVVLYDMKQIHLKKSYIKRKNEKNERIKQKSQLIVQDKLILMFGVERNIYLYNFETQKIDLEFSTGRYTEIFMFDYFRMTRIMFNSQNGNKNDEIISFDLPNNYLPLYFTIETDQKLDYFLNILEAQDDDFKLLNESKLIKVSLFHNTKLLILEETVLYVFLAKSMEFPSSLQFRASPQQNQKFNKFVISQDQQSVFLLDNSNKILILSNELQLITEVNFQSQAPVLLMHSFSEKSFLTLDSQNQLSSYKQFGLSDSPFLKISILDVKLKQTTKILVPTVTSQKLYLIGEGVIQITENVSGLFPRLEITNSISSNINFNYNITTGETGISLNELNQFIFHFDTSNMTAYPYINIYDFIQRSHIKTLDISKYQQETKELQKIMNVFQLEYSTIIILNNQIVINYNNIKMMIVDSFNFASENNNIKFTQALSLSSKQAIIFFNKNIVAQYNLKKVGEDEYSLVKGNMFTIDENEIPSFQIDLILYTSKEDSLILFNSIDFSAKKIKLEAMTLTENIFLENTPSRIQQVKCNAQESILLISQLNGDLLFYTSKNHKITQFKDRDTLIKDFWFLEEQVVMVVSQPISNSNFKGRIHTTIFFWVLQVDAQGEVTIQSYESFNTRMTKQVYYSEEAQLLYGMDDCEGCNYVEQVRIFKNKVQDGSVSPYRAEQLYTDNLDSSHPNTIIYSAEFDKFVVNKVSSGVEINQNMNTNIYTQLLSNKHNEDITCVKISEIDQLIFIVFQFIIEVWNLVDNSLLIDNTFIKGINKIINYVDSNLIAISFQNSNEVQFWNYKSNTVFSHDFPVQVKDLCIQSKNLYVFFNEESFFEVCINFGLAKQISCSRFQLHKKPINNFKFDTTGILYTSSENQVISWEITENSFDYRILQIYETEHNLTTINQFYIDTVYQRVFIQSPTTLIAYNYQAQLEKILQVITSLEDESSQGLEFGDSIIVKWSKNYFRIFDRQSLQFLEKQVQDQIAQVVVLNQPKIIAVLLGQESSNSGQVMKFNYEQFFNLRSIEGDLYIGKINLKKIWYDNDSNRIIGIENNGQILFWEQENGRKEIREDQIVRITNDLNGADIILQNLIFDNIHNNIIAYDKKNIYNFEGSNYWSRGGMYTHLPDLEQSSTDNQDSERDPEYEKSYIYDKTNDEFTFSDGSNNILFIKNNKQYFIRRSSVQYRKFLQIDNYHIAAYDQETLYLLDRATQSEIIDTLDNQKILNCRQDTRKLTNQSILPSYIVCFNRYRQIIQYLFNCTQADSCKIVPQEIYTHPNSRIMEIKIIYPYLISYDLSGLVNIYQLDIDLSYKTGQGEGSLVEKHQLLRVIQSCVINYKLGQILIQSSNEILMILISNNILKSFLIKKNYEIQLVYSDMDYNRLFIQQKYIKTLKVYKLINEQESLEQQIQLSSLFGNGIINTSKHILIFSDFQINLYDRQSLQILDYYKNPRDSKYINTIKIINDEIFITLERFGIRIFYISTPDENNKVSIRLFRILKIDSPILISRSYEINSVKLLGLSRSSFFNYTISADSLQICKYEFPPIQNNHQLLYYTNKLDQSAQSLFSSEVYSNQKYNFLINLIPSVNNKELSYIDEFKTKFAETSIAYQSSSNNSILILDPQLFMRYSQKILILQNVVLSYEQDDSSKEEMILKFNSEINRIQFYNITIIGNSDLKNLRIVFEGMERIYISNVTIKNVNMTNSNIFNIINCNNVEIHKININNIQKAKDSTIITALNIKNKLIIDDIKIKNTNTNNHLFVFSSLENIQLSSVTFQTIKYFDDIVLEPIIYTNETYLIQIEAASQSVEIGNVEALNIQGIGFIQYTNTYKGKKSDEIVYYDSVQVINVKMENSRSANSISFFAISANSVVIQEFNTFNMTCTSCKGTSLHVSNYQFLQIDNSSFEQSSGYIGGALYLNTDQYGHSDFGLTNTKFNLNSASQFGGAIYQNKFDLSKIQNVFFTSNHAPIGGAVRYHTAYKPEFPSNFYSEITFFNNSAIIFGNDFGSYPHRVVFQKVKQDEENYDVHEIKVTDLNTNTLINKSLSGEDTNNIEDKLEKIAQAFNITNMRSGSILSLQLMIFDENNQMVKLPQNIELYGKELVKEFEEYEIQFSSSNYNLVIDKKMAYSLISKNTESSSLSSQTYQSHFLIQDTAIIGQPLSYDFINIYIPFLKSYFFKNEKDDFDIAKLSPKLVIKTHFRNCHQGEILQKSNQFTIVCHRCEDNSYSVATYEFAKTITDLLHSTDQYKCQRCPYYAESCQMNQIILKDNYWRATNTSDEIIYCENRPSNCIAKNEDKFYCIEGNVGPLCEECDINGDIWGESYTSSGDYSCTQCNGNSSPVIKYTFLYLGILLYIVFSLIFFLQIYISTAKTYYLRLLGIISLGNSSLNHRSSIFAKQMLHYFQVMSVVQVLDYKIPFSFNFVPVSLGSPIQNMNGASDCLFRQRNIPQVYLRVILSLIIPIVFKCIIYFFIELLLRFMNIKIKQHKLQMVIIFSIIFFQPNVVNYFISVISCRRIGQESYINADLTQICYSEEHLQYTYFLVLPSLAIWVFFPLVILKGLINCRSKLNFITTQYKYGFLYMEYKEKCYYWEFVRLYVKLIIFLTINMLKSQPNISYVFVANYLLVYAYYILKLKPFQNNFLNRLDFQTVIVLLGCLFFNIIYKNTTNPVLKDLVSILQIVISYGFLIVLAFYMVRQKIKELKKHLLKRFARWKVKYPNLLPECCKKINLEDSTMRVNINWLRFKKKVYRSLTIKRNLETLNDIQQSQHNFNVKEIQQTDQNQVKQSCKIATKMKSLDVFLQSDKTIPPPLFNVTSTDKYKSKIHLRTTDYLHTTKDRKISKETGEIELNNIDINSSRIIPNFRKKSTLIPIELNRMNTSQNMRLNQLLSDVNVSTPVHNFHYVDDSPMNNTIAPLGNLDEQTQLYRNNRIPIEHQAIQELSYTVSKQIRDPAETTEIKLNNFNSKDQNSICLRTLSMQSSSVSTIKGLDEDEQSNHLEKSKQTKTTQSSLQKSIPLFASIKNMFAQKQSQLKSASEISQPQQQQYQQQSQRDQQKQ